MDDEQLEMLEEKNAVDPAPSAADDTAAQLLSDEDRELLKKYAHTFNGTFTHSLDSKGRMIVPAPFRAQLGETFCIGPAFNFKSVALYPTIVWVRLRDSYAKLGPHNPSLNAYLEQFDALSFREQECDNQGRVLLPARLRELILKNEKDVEVKGSHDHVKIAIRKKADEGFMNFLNNIDSILGDISELSMQKEMKTGH